MGKWPIKAEKKASCVTEGRKGQVFILSCGTVLSVSNQVMRFECFEMYMCTVTYLDIIAYYKSMLVLL